MFTEFLGQFFFMSININILQSAVNSIENFFRPQNKTFSFTTQENFIFKVNEPINVSENWFARH